MKCLILIVLCAGALSVPLGSQDDPLTKLLQKVLEANPRDNDISANNPLVNPDQAEGEFTTPVITEVKTELPVTEEANLAVEERDSAAESQDDIKSYETVKLNISETETTSNDKATDNQILQNVNQGNVPATDEQTTLPSELVMDDKMEGPFLLDPQTEHQYDPTVFDQHEKDIDYDGDAIIRIPLDRQDNWNPNLYAQDNYEPTNKDYEDHMTMLSNPYLSPVDTLPLDPSLMNGSSDHHEIPSPDYQFYDYIDETGSKVNNAHDEEIKTTPNESIMEENLTADNQAPNFVDNNGTSLTGIEDPEGIPTYENQNVMGSELFTNDEIPASTMDEMKNDQQFKPNTMDINLNDLHSEVVNADEQMAMNELKETLTLNSPPMEDVDYDTMSMNNEFIPRYSTSGKIPYGSFAQYMTRDDMNYFNPYTFHPNDVNDMLFRALLQEENAYRNNRYNLRYNMYPEDRKTVFNYDMDTGIQRNDPINQVPLYGNSMMQDTENMDTKDDVPSINKMGYYNGMEDDNSMTGSEYTPMNRALPLTRQNPIIEISQNSEKDYSTSNSFDQNEQDNSMLYDRYLRNLEKSFNSNSMMNQFNGNPFSRSNVPTAHFVDSAFRNEENMINSNRVSGAEDRENQMMENAFVNDEGTLLTDIQRNIDIPYSPSYHPAYYPWHHYYNINQYPSGYKAQQYYDMTRYPYSSNYFPSQYNDLGYSSYYSEPIRSGNYYPYSSLVNFYSQPQYYRRNPLNYLNTLYY